MSIKLILPKAMQQLTSQRFRVRIIAATACLFFILFSATGNAQALLKGQVKDTAENRTLTLSSVVLLRQGDSTLYRYTRAGENGRFSINNITPGKYVLLISCPKFVDYSDTITLTAGQEADLGAIAMTPRAKILEMAVVKQKIAAMRWKGDTLVIKADSIKVADDASVEDLLKRIPGFQVDKNGNIKAMGEKVEKVLVDGEEFFGDDPTIATRNLDARAVNEVELFDKKSDQAVFSGVDDGSKIKTINLKLKEDRKKGYFGKIDAGSNGRELWDNSGMINSFMGKRKVSAYGIMSKTGKTGLNWGENMNYGNTGGMETVSNGDGNFFISNWGDDDDEDNWDGRFSGAGIPKSWAAGLNYNNKWNGDRQTFNANYKFGRINTPAFSASRSQYILPDTSYFINNTGNNFSSNESQRVNMNSTLKLDSMSTLRINASVGRTRNTSLSSIYKESLNEELGFVNTNKAQNNQSGTTSSASADITYSRNFKKLRRNLTINTGFNMRDQRSNGFLFSETVFFSGGAPVQKDTLDQKRERNTDILGLKAGVTWSEPVGKTGTVQLSYEMNHTGNHAVKNAFDKQNDKYETINNNNSTDFKLKELVNTAGLTYTIKLKKSLFTASNKVLFTNQQRKDLRNGTTRDVNFTNVMPRINFRHNPNKTTYYNISVTGSTQQPTPDQLQPLQENSDPLNIIVGNPFLKPSFRGSLNFWFNKYIPETENGINLSINMSNHWNRITSRESFDNQGRRTSTYFNQADGNNRIGIDGGYRYKIQKTPVSLSMSASGSVSNNANFINNVLNKTKTISYELSPGIQIYDDENFWSSIGSEFGWNKSSSSINTDARPQFRTNRTYLDIGYNKPKKFSVGTDFNYNFREKTSPNDADNEIFTWNMNASVKLGKKEKNFTLGLYVYDILNQNNGFSRNITPTGISETSNEVLRRYWLLRLTWKFAKNGKPAWEN